MYASISHDMRTPLNTIINMHKLIATRVSDPNLLDWLNVATISTNFMLHLVNDTLDYFQIRSGKFVKRESKFFLQKMIDDCLNLISV